MMNKRDQKNGDSEYELLKKKYDQNKIMKVGQHDDSSEIKDKEYEKLK